MSVGVLIASTDHFQNMVFLLVRDCGACCRATGAIHRRVVDRCGMVDSERVSADTMGGCRGLTNWSRMMNGRRCRRFGFRSSGSGCGGRALLSGC
jgi:hypothetical protein